MERRPQILLAATGSVASIKVATLCRLLLEIGDVKLIVTSSAKHFINEDELPDAVKPILGDETEWRQWRAVGDPVLHIDLRRWADVLVVAPLSANSLAKLANGMADNLLTCVVRAWDFRKPLLVAPAMNTAMWASPFTARHLDTLTQLGAGAGSSSSSGGGGSSAAAGASSGGCSTVVVVAPVSKRLACGDEGTGAMAAPETIAAACRAAVQRVSLVAPEHAQQPQTQPEGAQDGRQGNHAGTHVSAGDAVASGSMAVAAVAAEAAAVAAPAAPSTSGRGGTGSEAAAEQGHAADGTAGPDVSGGSRNGSAEPAAAGAAAATVLGAGPGAGGEEVRAGVEGRARKRQRWGPEQQRTHGAVAL
ncbi:hypothetical protein CHLRE_10g423450v5 [Chlamydomonas reinhardtii]|uniref:phosphopantothenoylcysteine decarboxylase n=1 Tax=Chlamydomonas reinhardtii TaxID=3055 RepID=A8ICF7_CHLRE|nr:uncharacterized protein CHLRE_10g423450v5 [Chlamydomonas reinhardtii]PNW77132.1 hypothetical protein CHLRE_10g423450v5 [Chlamydomonas reinhardtii]|eukprot:XP_001702584.1 phosphopantothenoylcysteine decarboxylase [Chlamydomonas reinhardtii]